MKVRLGITAPTTLLQDKDALVQARKANDAKGDA